MPRSALRRGRKKDGRNLESAVAFASRIRFPYFSSEGFPAALPTTDEIENPREILQERTAAKVVLVNSCYVVKYGAHIHLDEGRAMILAERIGIPVPRVYALYREGGKNYIVMERINGKIVENVWQDLTEKEKKSVTTQMRQHFKTLRQIPSPGGYCSLNNEPLRDSMFLIEGSEGVFEHAGPFDSELDLINAILTKYKMSEALRGKARFYERILPMVFRNHPAVFTHGDIQRKNLMLRAEKSNGFAVVLLDWEYAGWYPAFWEYAQIMNGCGFFTDDWYESISHMLKPYPNEHAHMHIMQQEVDY